MARLVVRDLTFKKIQDIEVGLFLGEEGCLCFKSQYANEKGAECFIVSSGEFYWGDSEKLLQVEIE